MENAANAGANHWIDNTAAFPASQCVVLRSKIGFAEVIQLALTQESVPGVS
jgi:hypothetical protein